MLARGSCSRTIDFCTVEEAIADIAAGRMIVVVDDEDRENEGDLVMAAEFVTPEAINFMTRRAGGWICLALSPQRCDELGLDLMATGEGATGTPFTATIEAREGVTTGISVADQAHTMRVALDPAKGRQDLLLGGHVHPLRARAGGVLERPGHTEAAVDLSRLAGLTPGGVICEIQNEDGSMARVPELVEYCAVHGLKMITIADLVAHRRRRPEVLVERVVSTSMPTGFGAFDAVGYRGLLDGMEHVALVKGAVAGRSDVLVRVHSACLTGDTFHSLRCDCGQQLQSALERIEAEGAGVLLYLAQEGRGIGLLNKLRAYRLQEDGLDTVEANLALGMPAEAREYGVAAQMLTDLGVRSVRLLTNNPAKVEGLTGHGLVVSEQVAIEHPATAHNEAYLRTKRDRMGHTLSTRSAAVAGTRSGDDGRRLTAV